MKKGQINRILKASYDRWSLLEIHRKISEEAGEFLHAVSKWVHNPSKKEKKDHLEQEIADLEVMIMLLKEHPLLSKKKIARKRNNRIAKINKHLKTDEIQQ